MPIIVYIAGDSFDILWPEKRSSIHVWYKMVCNMFIGDDGEIGEYYGDKSGIESWEPVYRALFNEI